MVIVMILLVSGALIAGAAWGVYGRLSESLEGFLLALAGGALLVSSTLELIEPSLEKHSLAIALASVFAGASTFTLVSYFLKKKVGADQGAGLLAAITFNGIPENLALGVALIGAEPMQVAALSASIFLSNLPEAAGGANEMSDSGKSKKFILSIWTGTAVLLSACALLGHQLLVKADPEVLAYNQCFAGGAVVASLALEIFPKSFKKDHFWSGIAVAIGLILALYLNTLK